jgi:hypothetical protein
MLRAGRGKGGGEPTGPIIVKVVGRVIVDAQLVMVTGAWPPPGPRVMVLVTVSVLVVLYRQATLYMRERETIWPQGLSIITDSDKCL